MRKHLKKLMWLASLTIVISSESVMGMTRHYGLRKEHSMDTKLCRKAWKVIRRNYGCPGTDNISWEEIKRDYNMYERLVEETIKNPLVTRNYYRKTITDYLGNERAIYVYDIIARWTQQTVKLLYQEKLDHFLSENLYSYRSKKNLHKMRSAMVPYLNKPFLRIDIKGYFGNIDIHILKKILKKYFRLKQNEIEFLFLFLYPIEKGLPQGNCLSPYLSNLYLFELDCFLKDHIHFRYSDDIFIMVEDLEYRQLLKKIEKLLKTLKLEINSDKTCYIKALHHKDFL